MMGVIFDMVLDLAKVVIEQIEKEPTLFSADTIDKAIDLVDKRQALAEAKEIAIASR